MYLLLVIHGLVDDLLSFLLCLNVFLIFSTPLVVKIIVGGKGYTVIKRLKPKYANDLLLGHMVGGVNETYGEALSSK